MNARADTVTALLHLLLLPLCFPPPARADAVTSPPVEQAQFYRIPIHNRPVKWVMAQLQADGTHPGITRIQAGDQNIQVWDTPSDISALQQRIAALDTAQRYVELSFTEITLSRRDSASLGYRTRAKSSYPLTLSAMERRAGERDVALQSFALPTLMVPDGVSGLMHFPKNVSLGTGTLTVGTNVTLTPDIEEGGTVILSVFAETQHVNPGAQDASTSLTDLALRPILHSGVSQWLGHEQDADGRDHLVYATAVPVEASASVVPRTQALIMNGHTLFTTGDPAKAGPWVSAQTSIMLQLSYLDVRGISVSDQHDSSGPSITAHDGDTVVIPISPGLPTLSATLHITPAGTVAVHFYGRNTDTTLLFKDEQTQEFGRYSLPNGLSRFVMVQANIFPRQN